MTRLAFPFLLAFAGCSTDTGSTDTSGDTAADADTDTDSDSDTDTDTDTDTDADADLATLTGSITLPDGSPAANFRVNVCKMVCMTAKTDASGAYTLAGLDPSPAAMYVEATGDNDYAVNYVPVVFAAAETKTVDLAVTSVQGTVDLSSGAEHDIGDTDLVLVADDASYLPSVGTDPIAELTWASTADPGVYGPVAFDGETVLAVYYFGPFEGHGEGSLKLRNMGAEPGATVNVWYADLPTGTAEWTSAGQFVSVNGEEFYEGEADLPVLTAVALTTPM
jgi:hypothetical protein